MIAFNRKMSLFCLACVLSISLAASGAKIDDQVKLGNIKAGPGEMSSGYLHVPEKDGIKGMIPVTIINGAENGKTLALVAGIHGYEYPPILSLYRLKERIDPQKLSGTLILVHVAHLHAFQKRIIYYSPYDWKNLNRVFPGDPEGSITQRIAYVIKQNIVEKCDGLIDLHCGDGNEALIPYTYWMISGKEELDKTTKQMALAFGIKHIIIDKSRTRDLSHSKYLGNTAVLLSKPAITTESGYLGHTDEESVARIINGILNVMKLFDMLEGQPEYVSDPVWIDKYEVVYSDVDGLFYPQTHMGYYVRKGERVGYITDYFGKVIKSLRAPFTGIVLYIIHTPPANKGEPLFEIGAVMKN